MFEFPGKYYEIIRKSMRDVQAEADFLAALAGRDGHVLDLGCGTGTTLRALAERQVTGVGVDSSAEFISWAKNSGPAGVDFVHTSMLDFATTEQFDVVCCLFATLNLLPPDEIAGLFSRAREWLRPGGRLVIDAAHLLSFVDSYQPSMATHHKDDGVLITRQVRTLVHGHTANWRNEETILVRETAGGVALYENFFDQWVITVPEIRRLLGGAGFEIAAEYGGFRQALPSPIGKGPLIQVATETKQ